MPLLIPQGYDIMNIKLKTALCLEKQMLVLLKELTAGPSDWKTSNA